jgi:hypothetical protein
MNCKICGAALPENAKFCGKCGAKFGAVPAPIEPKPMPAQPRSKKPLIIAVAVILALITIGLVIFLCSDDDDRDSKRSKKSNDAETVAEEYINIVYCGDGDAKDLIELYHPDVVSIVFDDQGVSKKARISDINDHLEEIQEELEDEDVEITEVEIRSVKDLSDDDFEDLEEYYDDVFDLTIDEAKFVKIRIYADVDGEEDTENEDLVVVKIDGDYYLDEDYNGYLLYID